MTNNEKVESVILEMFDAENLQFSKKQILRLVLSKVYEDKGLEPFTGWDDASEDKPS